MNWLARFMYGRYGTDQLGLASLIAMFILNIIYAFTGWSILYWLAFLLCVWCMWRIFSKNISRRYAENQKFLAVFAPVRKFARTKAATLSDLKTHRHYRCPSCRQKIRVPRGRGKIQITCPNCRREFIKKS